MFAGSRVSRIQKFFFSANHGGQQYFSVFHGPSTLKSISPVLPLMSYNLALNGFDLEFQHETTLFQTLLRMWFKTLSVELEVIFNFVVKEPMQSCIRQKIIKFHKMFSTCSNLRLD